MRDPRRIEPPDLPSHREAEIEWKPLTELRPTTVTLEGVRVGRFEVGMYLCEVLEVRFGGVYREGSMGNPDAAAMSLQVLELLARAEPDVVLLDLSALRYTWGDAITRVFEVIARYDHDDPVGAVVLGGPSSAPALTSLGVAVHTDASAALEEAKTRALRRSVDIG